MAVARKIKRRHLIYYLRVFEAKRGKLIGHVVDITTQGMLLIGEKPVETNKNFVCRMMLPGSMEAARQIEFNACSIWCKKDINPDFYAIGFSINEIAVRDVRRIEFLIEKYGFVD